MASTSAPQVRRTASYSLYDACLRCHPSFIAVMCIAAASGLLLPQMLELVNKSQDVATEAEDDKDANENSLYKEDSFRMYCMKVP